MVGCLCIYCVVNPEDPSQITFNSFRFKEVSSCLSVCVPWVWGYAVDGIVVMIKGSGPWL